MEGVSVSECDDDQSSCESERSAPGESNAGTPAAMTTRARGNSLSFALSRHEKARGGIVCTAQRCSFPLQAQG